MRNYGITSVPASIIDASKVVCITNFPSICGDDLYNKLTRELFKDESNLYIDGIIFGQLLSPFYYMFIIADRW